MHTEHLTPERRTELLAEIIRVQGLVNDFAEPRSLFAPMLDVLVEYSESEFGFIGEVFTDEHGDPFLRTHAITNIAWDQETLKIYARNEENGFEFRNLKTLFGKVLTSGETVISNSPRSDPRRGGVPEGHPPLNSFMGIPFFRRDKMVGMVGVANSSTGYSDGLRQSLEPVLSSCAFIIDAFRVAAERKAFESELRKSEALHRGILDAANDSIVAINPSGLIVSANSSVKRMFGYEPGELIGRNVNVLMPAEIASEHDRYIQDYLDSEVPKVIGIGRDVTGRHRDGTFFPVELAVSKVCQDDSILFTGIIRDIRDRKRAEQERANAYAQLVAVLDSCSRVSVIATDTTGLITLFNRGAENMLGYTSAEMVGRQTPAVLHDPAEVEAYGKQLSASLNRDVQGFDVFVTRARTSQFDRREWTYIRANGSRIEVDLTVTAVLTEDHEVTGYLGVALDVTSRNEAERELIRAKEAAESANRAKSEFVANMSHEIRTPINGIIGMQELMRQTNLTPEQAEYVEASGNCAQALLDVVNEVLDYSKIEAGHLELNIEEFHLRTLMEETLVPLKIRAERKGLSLTWEIDPTLPSTLRSDPARIRQILLNLTGNAVKFTSEGRVSVRIATSAQTEEHRILTFEVSDTGPGISPEAQAEIFDPFIQADSSTTRTFGGTGLGLTISRRLAELLGGTIQLQSEPGRGTTFCFSAPVQVSRHAPAETDDTESARGTDQTRPLHILLAEDHPVNQLFTSKLLEKEGHQVTIVENGRDAVDQAHKGGYDIILMDIQMPVMDGLEAIARIRRFEQQEGNRIPIIALTAHAMTGYDQRCYAAGADAYISKPLRPGDLQRTIQKLLSSSDRKCQQPAPASDAGSRSGPIDEHIILHNTGADRELAAELIGIFENDLPTTLKQLEEAIAREDLETVHRLAHSLKSPLMMFGATTACDQSHKLESAAGEPETAKLSPMFELLRAELKEVSAALRTTDVRLRQQ